MKNQAIHPLITKLEELLNEYLVKKAPAIPANIKDILVAIVPWFELISLLISIPFLLAALGISAFLFPLPNYTDYQPHVVGLICIFISFILSALAVPGLFNKQRQGWLFLFYAHLVGLVGTLLSLSLGGILGTIIFFYILFQIRERYK